MTIHDPDDDELQPRRPDGGGDLNGLVDMEDDNDDASIADVEVYEVSEGSEGSIEE